MSSKLSPIVRTDAGPDGDDDLISIVVPTYNRARYLEKQIGRLTSTYSQELHSGTLEILIFDDASADDTAMVCAAYGSRIRYLSSRANVGGIEARRRLCAAARGRYIVHLDDDSYLLDAEALALIRDHFAANPDCGVIAGNVATERFPCGLFPVSHRPLRAQVYVGCCCAMRADAVRSPGPYPAFLKGYGAEETALSLRLLEDGYDVMVMPSLRVYHAEEPIQRPMISRRANTFANLVGIVIAYYPLPTIPFEIAHKVASHVIYNHRQGALVAFAREAALCLPGVCRLALQDRRPIRLRTLLRFYGRQISFERCRRAATVEESASVWPESKMVGLR